MSRTTAIPAAYILVCRGEEILLSTRLNTGYMDGRHQVPAGHVEAREMPAEAALRELKEEVGITARPEDLEFVHAAYRERRDEDSERLDVFFRLRRWEGEISNPEPDKCGGWEWHPINRLPPTIIPYLARIIGRILQGLPYSENRQPL